MLASIFTFFQVLQEVGIYDKLHRFAGVSMGAVFATLMALGFTPREVKEFSRTLDASAFLGKYFMSFCFHFDLRQVSITASLQSCDLWLSQVPQVGGSNPRFKPSVSHVFSQHLCVGQTIALCIAFR